MIVTLRNVVEWNREHPTFEIPPHDVRSGLMPGDFAKLVFEGEGGMSERMWVRVTRAWADDVDGHTRYLGTLANDPVVVDLKHGDEVSFDEWHVCNAEDGVDG